MNSGHFGEGGRFAECEDIALEYAYLIKVIGALGDEEPVQNLSTRRTQNEEC